MKEYMKNIEAIDILKGIAILLVIFVHVPQRFPIQDEWLKMISKYGQFGVQAFFVISGFTLSYSYSKNKNIKDFYKKRFKRIVPEYWGMLFIYTTIGIINNLLNINISNILNLSKKGFILNFFLIHGTGILTEYRNNVVLGGWFVGVISIFYFLFPYIFKIINKLKEKNEKIIVILPFLTTIFSFIIGYFIGKDYYSIFNQVTSFIVGIILFFSFEKINIKYHKLRNVFSIIGLGIISAILFYGDLEIIKNEALQLIMGLFWTEILIFIYKADIKNKIIASFGKQSYQIYLIHCIFVFQIPYFLKKLLVFFNLKVNVTVQCAVALVLTIILSYFSAKLYKIIIDYIKNMVDKLIKKIVKLINIL